MSYEGSCHCGAVAFRVDGDVPTEALSCNCSHCRRKGFLLSFVPVDTFSLVTGDEISDGMAPTLGRKLHTRIMSALGGKPTF